MTDAVETRSYRFNSRLLETDAAQLSENGVIEGNLDLGVGENNSFVYNMVFPKGIHKTKKVVFLFHGLNEKSWKKYIPWAELISKGTGSAVVLFPIAFHMQRVPSVWKDRKNMELLSKSRKAHAPDLEASSSYNASLSERLQARPERFLESALRTYDDVLQLIEDCKQGKHPHIEKDFSIDFFSYSIGGYLAQMLKFTNHNGYFTNSKLCLFCSGSTLDRTSPISKFILDSEAGDELQSYFKKNSIDFSNQSEHGFRFEEKVFRSFFDYDHMKDFRNDLLKKYGNHIYVIALKKDMVIHSSEIQKTMLGGDGESKVSFDLVDFEREYSHEIPFPIHNKPTDDLAQADMQYLFDKVCRYFNT